jgi:hypothetical protein
VSLRYFNAAGCDPQGRVGERHDPETHLIPLVLAEAMRTKKGGDPSKTALRVFGSDFPTVDGSCVRDYIHVSDLCSAHLLAAERLFAGKVNGFEAYNLANGVGFSVLQVIEACREVTGQPIRYRMKGGARAIRRISSVSARGRIPCSAGSPSTPSFAPSSEPCGTGWGRGESSSSTASSTRHQRHEPDRLGSRVPPRAERLRGPCGDEPQRSRPSPDETIRGVAIHRVAKASTGPHSLFERAVAYLSYYRGARRPCIAGCALATSSW